MPQLGGGAELCTTQAVLAYVRQLDDHRKKCELSGRYVTEGWLAHDSPATNVLHILLAKPMCPYRRYSEAAAAAARIKELRAAEAKRLTGVLTAAHNNELLLLQDSFRQVRCVAGLLLTAESTAVAPGKPLILYSRKTSLGQQHH